MNLTYMCTGVGVSCLGGPALFSAMHLAVLRCIVLALQVALARWLEWVGHTPADTIASQYPDLSRIIQFLINTFTEQYMCVPMSESF